MISRTAFNQRCDTPAAAAGNDAGLGAGDLPIATVAAGQRQRGGPTPAGLTAWVLMSLLYVPMVRFYRLNPLWTLMLPAAAAFYAGLSTVHSAQWQYQRLGAAGSGGAG